MPTWATRCCGLSGTEGRAMQDLVFVALTVLSFVGLLALVAGLARL